MLEVFSCMNERSHRAIEKILIHSKKCIHYSLAQDDWIQDERTLEAIVFNLAQIGELVRFVDESVQSKYPFVNWAAMKGLRNRIIHDYEGILPNNINAIVMKGLPELVFQLESILENS